MRRAVWADFPYPEVDYGEDQVWARDIIEAGLTKLYAPTACVFHSHDYDPDETFKRARTEAAFFFTHFGYALGDGTEDALAARIKREHTDYRGWAYRHPTSPDAMARRLDNIEAKHRGWKAGLDEARGPADHEEYDQETMTDNNTMNPFPTDRSARLKDLTAETLTVAERWAKTPYYDAVEGLGSGFITKT